MIKPARRPPVVIIVDDDDLVTRALARVIRAGGLVPKVYKDPVRFLAEIDSQKPACILLDITMPRITGLQVQAQLEARGIAIPVIAVSARDDDETRRRARELDAKVFFRKPVDDQALLDAIAWVIQSRPDAPGGDSGNPQAPDDT